MSRWLVPLIFYGEVEVEAETKEKAVDIAEQSISISDCDAEVTDNMIQNLDENMFYVLENRKDK